ncbi:2-C-methyl-D-erythritol 4-phosphate cytidylyltransferase [Hymenobacter sp. BT770]|uniref:2-C-methyl-D-erythritol 4-phosphate cytidylyltransferase n=1 Tax=Hymenobacter sp. BT770 TaxID=2886942 RepID=UPI001D104301|nr:2-C-methyl-D-erythritol 4-phosphate cytidylyltransferase [Hymenobacter sp. BT770]MCC3153739.1 2-C-methyl-D-erythritol 4-phosphate cytidylyltransferase [Hymenobacter sp. BT770]MDO3413703.1 2-C-methyl-D-erythritol 4-phosphate cytidylyltransferase [Hymenobacter sp. BT770]
MNPSPRPAPQYPRPPVPRFAILVAGGSGTRMAADRPKQFLLLHGEPVLLHTLRRFAEPALGVAEIIVVLPASQMETWQQLCQHHQVRIPHTLVAGGATRWASVKAGLGALRVHPEGLVAVHDGVRPLVSRLVVERTYAAAATHAAAAAAVMPKDSVRLVSPHGSSAQNRSRLRLMQTPQTFEIDLLRRAYAMPELASFTDDATVVDDLCRVQLVEGDYRNLKITTPEDLIVAEALLRATA